MRASRRHLSPRSLASRSHKRQPQVPPLLTMRPTFLVREMSSGPSPYTSGAGADSLTWWESSARGNLLQFETADKRGSARLRVGSIGAHVRLPSRRYDFILFGDETDLDGINMEQPSRNQISLLSVFFASLASSR